MSTLILPASNSSIPRVVAPKRLTCIEIYVIMANSKMYSIVQPSVRSVQSPHLETYKDNAIAYRFFDELSLKELVMVCSRPDRILGVLTDELGRLNYSDIYGMDHKVLCRNPLDPRLNQAYTAKRRQISYANLNIKKLSPFAKCDKNA